MACETGGSWEGDGRRLEVDTSVVYRTLDEFANKAKNAVVTAYGSSGGKETGDGAMQA